MATIDLQGTKFTFSLLPLKLFSDKNFARAEMGIENEFVSYSSVEAGISREELEEWIFSMRRLLAGAYVREHSTSFDRAGFAVDFYPYTEDGKEASREARRENDCVMALRLLMRSKDKKRLLGGVYSFLFHREDIEFFSSKLREEFDEVFAQLIPGSGKHVFVGVSPRGYTGCNYWYLDTTGKVQAGDYVWVRMGRHDTEQIVYVDSVRRFQDGCAPYDPAKVKQVIRKAAKEELE